MKWILRIVIICLAVVFLLIGSGLGANLNGKSGRHCRWDTLTLLTAQKEQKKIRLAEIDTPEKAQP